jgi:hypothetical protein
MSKDSNEMLNDFMDLLNGETDKLKKKYGGKLVGEINEMMTGDPKALQKKYRDEAYEKYIEKFASTIHLWKLEDKQWVSNRKAIWEKIVDGEKKKDRDFVKSYWDETGRFYLRAKPRKSDNEIYVYRRMAYTPFTSVEQIRELYMSEHVSLRQNLHEQLLTYTSRAYRAVPEEFHRVQLIAEALYFKDYVARKEPMGLDKKPKFVVYYPRDFIISYTNEVRNYLKHSNCDYLEDLRRVYNQHNTGNERSFSEVTIEYFLGVLEYAVLNETDEYGGTIEGSEIEGVKEICSLIESYNPDIKDKNRDKFIERASEIILNNQFVIKVREMQV